MFVKIHFYVFNVTLHSDEVTATAVNNTTWDEMRRTRIYCALGFSWLVKKALLIVRETLICSIKVSTLRADRQIETLKRKLKGKRLSAPVKAHRCFWKQVHFNIKSFRTDEGALVFLALSTCKVICMCIISWQ